MKHLSLAVLISALLTSVAASANERLFFQIPAMLDPSAPIPEAVKNECALDTLLGNYALSAINQRIGSVQSVTAPEQAGADKVAQLTILSVHAPGGGMWSGSKSMSIRVDVRKEGATVDSTILTRRAKAGGYSTCGMLERTAAALGKDVAVWLSRGSAAKPNVSGSETAEPSDE